MLELHQHHLNVCKQNYDKFCKLVLGDIVLIQNDSSKRNNWKRGKVERLIYGSDDKIRGAVLKVVNGGKVSYIQRPIQKLIPSEVQRECNLTVPDVHVLHDRNVTKNCRNRRRPDRLQVKW